MLEIEFTNETLVQGPRGVERLVDILDRDVKPCVWAIKWRRPEGISFHESHKHLREFVAVQLDSDAESPARLINVSEDIMKCVEEQGYCWTDLKDFTEAETYKVPSNHLTLSNSRGVRTVTNTKS